ncbi:MAG: 3-hydroxyacyl-CoA dehydrogenase NAD-binding domain-containing protein [Gammaproteobacteria bacterium]|nr:3-hydroxyacyl-CoA dehydrogenase NAD-binding domain-containing protein [Gammaproteobacteria bacterium]
MTDENTGASWALERDSDDIAWLCLDMVDSGANVLSQPIMRELAGHLSELEAKPPTGLVIWSGKKSGFIFGADIKEFNSLATESNVFEMTRLGQQIMDRIEALPCPSVALLNGFALGGGLEMALACDYRVAADNGRVSVGLPEVKLGINPGFGGTVRAVRIIGVSAAMNLMLSGRFLRAEKALRIGLIDRLVPDDEMRAAAEKLIHNKPPKHQPPLKEKLMNLPYIRNLVAGAIRKQVASRANPKHYPSPFAMIELWRKYGASDAQYEAEAKLISRQMVSVTGQNLIRVFMLQDRMKSVGGKVKSDVKRLHVIGAGAMGGGIAAWSALRGIDVTLQDREEKYVEPALQRARKLFEKKTRSPDDYEAAVSRLKMDVEGKGIEDADLIIEAIYENVEAKKSLYADLVTRMNPDALLATNTSSLMLETLSTDLPDPNRLFGLHFFNPVEKMPLIEVISMTDTPQEIINQGVAFARRIDRLPLPCRSAPGFVVNRVLMPYMIEASLIAEEGVAGPLIDRAALDFGMPMGPVHLSDVVGLDVALSVAKIFGEAFDSSVPAILEKLVAEKKLGMKTGEGFYRWVGGKPEKPKTDGEKAPDDIMDRLFMPLLNAAVALWSESVIDDLDMLDAGVIFGTGFAPFRGGPIHYARNRGIDDIVATMNRLADKHGDRFRPHESWSRIESIK